MSLTWKIDAESLYVNPIYQNSKRSCQLECVECGRHLLRGGATMRDGPMHQPLLPYSPERDVYRLLGIPSNAPTE